MQCVLYFLTNINLGMYNFVYRYQRGIVTHFYVAITTTHIEHKQEPGINVHYVMNHVYNVIRKTFLQFERSST